MNRKGVTLIELLIVMVILSVLVAAIYRTFISQQHTYVVQEQVVDMQQNLRMGITQMVRDIRMAGFGSFNTSSNFYPMHGVYNNIVNPIMGTLTVIGGYQQMTTLAADADQGSPTITVKDASGFTTTEPKKYICINGTEWQTINTIAGNVITLTTGLSESHSANEPVFLVKALTYSLGGSGGKMCLLRDENLGDGPQPVADNIESVQFAYFDANGNPTANPPDIRMIQVTIVAKTDMADPQSSGDGYRRRTLTTNIQLRNLTSS